MGRCVDCSRESKGSRSVQLFGLGFIVDIYANGTEMRTQFCTVTLFLKCCQIYVDLDELNLVLSYMLGYKQTLSATYSAANAPLVLPPPNWHRVLHHLGLEKTANLLAWLAVESNPPSPWISPTLPPVLLRSGYGRIYQAQPWDSGWICYHISLGVMILSLAEEENVVFLACRHSVVLVRGWCVWVGFNLSVFFVYVTPDKQTWMW